MDSTDEDTERAEELETLLAIYPELKQDENDQYKVSLDLDIELDQPINLRFVSQDGNPAEERRAVLTYLPLIKLSIILPQGYPSACSPEVSIQADPPWLPEAILSTLETMASDLWSSWGRIQIVYTYLDSLKDSAQTAFGLLPSPSSSITLDSSQYLPIMAYQARASKTRFDAQFFDCEVCLSTKPGSDCYKMSQCGHIFCQKCLRDFYSVHILEGDVYKVQCMAYNCHVTTMDGKKIYPTISPAELLQIPLDRTLVQRYADLKRKKKIEADQTTIYCPREWCQAPARSNRHPKMGAIESMTEMEDPNSIAAQLISVDLILTPAMVSKLPPPTKEEDRLTICESCTYAFCKTCKKSWHGPYLSCLSPTAQAAQNEADLASEDYVRKFTSECPTCCTRVQKHSGCNHMTCLQCRTHFCYLCGSWLDGADPYRHYNTSGRECFQRLFDLSEGDDADGVVEFVGARRWEMEAEDFAVVLAAAATT